MRVSIAPFVILGIRPRAYSRERNWDPTSGRLQFIDALRCTKKLSLRVSLVMLLEFTMNDDDPKFEVLSIADMRKKFYSLDEQPPIVTISPERVPQALHCLIPFAERWGISDDILRSDAIRSASPDEVGNLKAAIARFDDELDDWLAGTEATSSNPTKEYLAFSNMRMAADGC